MHDWSPGLAQHARVHGARIRLTALSCMLFALVWLSACSSNSLPGSIAPVTNTNTNTNPAFTVSSSLPPATVNVTYNTALAITGGTAPYTFSMASGQLPAGVALADSSGMISGTPTAAGSFNFAVTVSDSKGVSEQQPLQITVANKSTTTGGGAGSGNSFSSVQHSSGWGEYGQGPPNFIDCSPSPCDGISYWMVQGVTSPSMSGEASEFNVGGTAVYSDALFNNHLIGPFSSQGMPDSNQTVVATLHNFTYDVYFYGTNLSISQAVEFDINQFFGNMGFIWGHECRVAGGNEWDVWDNVNAHWTPTGIACYPNSNAWNHLTIQVQRTSSDELLYQSITLNGVTSDLNWTFPHGSTPNWYGVTINYQMDGNYQQDSYNVYLDNLTFSYQ
jgi:hypothetical protein